MDSQQSRSQHTFIYIVEMLISGCRSLLVWDFIMAQWYWQLQRLNFKSKYLGASENAHYGEAKSNTLDEDELRSLCLLVYFYYVFLKENNTF